MATVPGFARAAAIALLAALGLRGAAAAPAGAALFSRVEDVMAAEMRTAGIPCAAVAVVMDGRVAYSKGFGEARPGVPADEDTPFYIGSVTKSMTALGVMRLAEEGKVELLAPATAYLPGFRMADPRYASIRVHDLLRQCSGLSTAQGVSYLGEPRGVTMGDLISRLGTARLASEPGSRYEYSNYNYVLLGEIIERVSGSPYSAYMRERVFAPLGMARTTASRAEAEAEGLAIGGRGFFGWTIRGQVGYPEGAVPEGYVASTARDMGAYLAFMQRRGIAPDGTRLVSEAGFERMTTVQSTGGAYGYGWAISPRAIRHGGQDAGFESWVWSRTQGPSMGYAVLAAFSDCAAENLVPLGGIQRMTRAVGSVLGTGEPPPPPPIAALYRAGAALAASLVLAIIAASALGLRAYFRPHDRGRDSRLVRGLRAAGALTLHLVLPLAALVLPPLLLATPWSTAILFAPDAALLFLGFASAELLVGAIKVILIYQGRRRRS